MDNNKLVTHPNCDVIKSSSGQTNKQKVKEREKREEKRKNLLV